MADEAHGRRDRHRHGEQLGRTPAPLRTAVEREQGSREQQKANADDGREAPGIHQAGGAGVVVGERELIDPEVEVERVLT